MSDDKRSIVFLGAMRAIGGDIFQHRWSGLYAKAWLPMLKSYDLEVVQTVCAKLVDTSTDERLPTVSTFRSLCRSEVDRTRPREPVNKSGKEARTDEAMAALSEARAFFGKGPAERAQWELDELANE